jgi:hypothetical protein
MTKKTITRLGAIGAVCALVGAAGGIAGGSAATSSKNVPKGPPPGPPHAMAVHEESVILNKAGTAFITSTEDHGTVKSVSGNDVTITEAEKGVTYKDVTITVPDGAKVIRNGKTASLSDLATGDHVRIEANSDGATVMAADAAFWKSHPRPGPGGPGGPGHPGGPPPPPPAN